MENKIIKQVTLVSFFGQKHGVLEKLIKDCWKFINDSKLKKIIEPYHISQIHGTLVGMEKIIGFKELYNANIWQASGNKMVMGYNKFLNVLNKHLPITIRFGGFDENYKDFMSFGETPYSRCFQVQRSTAKFTLIGWPHQDLDFTSKTILSDLRQEIGNECNIVHKYKNDNDLFMVLGELKNNEILTVTELSDIKKESIRLEQSVREFLKNNPIELEINSDNIFLVQYEKETLPLDSTNAFSINNSRISSNFISNLYC